MIEPYHEEPSDCTICDKIIVNKDDLESHIEKNYENTHKQTRKVCSKFDEDQMSGFRDIPS